MTIRWPWMTVARHEDVIREKNYQIGDRDKRISDLESERKLLWDMLAEMGLGRAVFNPRKLLMVEPEPKKPSNQPEPEPPPRRPSQVVARMTRKAFREFHNGRHPGQAERREFALRDLDHVEAEVVAKQQIPQ